MGVSMIFKVSLALSALFFTNACGVLRENDSQLNSEKFTISVLGIEMGSCTRDELSRFVGGERVPAISDKISKDQANELRLKFSRVISIPFARVPEALASELGSELRDVLGSIFRRDFANEKVNDAFSKSLEDGTMTLLEFVSLYPSETMHVNGIVFLAKKGTLEKVLLKMEQDFQ